MILYASNKFYGVELYPADICSPIIPSISIFEGGFCKVAVCVGGEGKMPFP
jgi:hypothetical protein